MSSSLSLPSITHILAASGDTILTLNNPNAPFAPWKGGSNPTFSIPSPRVTFQVSSHHLIQVSSVFKAALTGPWKEGSKNPDGFYEISAEDWDVEALLVVLYVIHSRTRSIPRTTTLEILSKIAVLVDYYGLHEALHFFASIWIDHLRHSLPSAFGRDLILWICASWVFKDAAIFQAVTKLAIEHSPGDLPTLHLPIPERVISQIDRKRAAAVLNIALSLWGLKRQLIGGQAGCSFECRSLLLGALVKYMHDDGFRDGSVTQQYEDRSLTDVIKRVREMKSPDRSWHRPSPGSYYNSCSFSLVTLTEPFLHQAASIITGLGPNEL